MSRNIQDIVEGLVYLRLCYGNVAVRITHGDECCIEVVDPPNFDTLVPDAGSVKENNTRGDKV